MRRATLFTGAILPFIFLACGGAPDSPTEGKGEEATQIASSALSGGKQARGVEDNTTALVNLACTVAASAAGVPEACTVLGGAETILAFIEGLDSGPNTQQQILNQLSQLNQQMVQVDSDIKTFWSAFNQAAAQIEVNQQLQTQGLIQQHESDAKDAAARLSEWIATGMSNQELIASIDYESSEAAMALTTSPYWYRAAHNAGDPPVFDMRNALLSYLYALSVRLAVIQAEDPNYRCVNEPHNLTCVMPYANELQVHLNFLNSLPGLNAKNFVRSNQLQGGVPGQYAMCDWVQDTNSGFMVNSDWQGNPPYGEAPSGCVGPLVMSSTQANDGMQFLAFWDNWWVEEEMGVHAVQKMAQTVTTDLTYDWPPLLQLCLPGHTCPTPYTPVGPLVDNNGLCLSMNHGSYPFTSGLLMEPCSQGAEYQTWQTGGMGQTASVGLSDQKQCIELNLWDGYSGANPDFEPCSGSSGEEFTVTSAGELRWARDSSLCLTSGGPPVSAGYDTYDQPATLKTCDGQPHQKWGRSWPVLIPIRL